APYRATYDTVRTKRKKAGGISRLFTSDCLAMVVIVAVFIFLVPSLVFAVVVVIVPTVAVAIAIAVPVMVVLKAAARSFPITAVVAPTFITRDNPDCALVRPACPVAPVPIIVPAYRIPVALDPGILILVLRFRTRWPHRVDARRRWRTNYNSDRDLAACRRRASKQSPTEQHHSHASFQIKFHDF